MNPKKTDEILKGLTNKVESMISKNHRDGHLICSKDLKEDILGFGENAILLAHNSCVDDVLEVWKDWIKKFEGCAVFSYLRGTDERIVTFNPSEKVWNKEFKENFTKKLKEMKQ